MKQCLDCLQTKVLSEFYKADKRSDGRHSYCIQCFKLRNKNQPNRTKSTKKYRDNNREKCRIASRLSKKKYPDTTNFGTMKRIAAKLNRTPKWLTKGDWIEIRWAYKIAKQLTKETGISYTVDHIIPLQGKEISGLHCPQNLQVIPARENESKGNKFLPGIIPRQ